MEYQLTMLWTDKSQFKQLHRCGSKMIECHLRLSGLENKFKIEGIWGKNGYNSIFPCHATLGFNHLIILLLLPNLFQK